MRAAGDIWLVMPVMGWRRQGGRAAGREWDVSERRGESNYNRARVAEGMLRDATRFAHDHHSCAYLLTASGRLRTIDSSFGSDPTRASQHFGAHISPHLPVRRSQRLLARRHSGCLQDLSFKCRMIKYWRTVCPSPPPNPLHPISFARAILILILLHTVLPMY